MVTLSFILVSNVFFLALLARQAIAGNPDEPIISWSLFSSFFRMNTFYVHVPRALLSQISTVAILKAGFNIFFRHTSVPGPLLWRMTDLTYAYYAARGDLHHQLLALHQKYG